MIKENKELKPYFESHPNAELKNITQLTQEEFETEKTFWEENCEKQINSGNYYKTIYEDETTRALILSEPGNQEIICIIEQEITLNQNNNNSNNPQPTDINNSACTENWNCTNWSNCDNNNQTRTCTELNQCGTDTNKPIENQTCLSTPETCTENWTCTNWSECINELQQRTCQVVKDCPDINNQPAIQQSCSTPQINIDEEWTIFKNNLTAMLNHNLSLANTYTYEDYNLDSCIASSGEDACWEMVDSVYSLSNDLAKEDFEFVERDSKQSVISTNIFEQDGQNYVRQIIFAKNSQNNLVIVKLIYQKSFGTDTDKDGLHDERENCLGAYQYDPSCEITSITKKDTDEDGWWDSTEEEAGTNPNDSSDYLFKTTTQDCQESWYCEWSDCNLGTQTKVCYDTSPTKCGDFSNAPTGTQSCTYCGDNVCNGNEDYASCSNDCNRPSSWGMTNYIGTAPLTVTATGYCATSGCTLTWGDGNTETVSLGEFTKTHTYITNGYYSSVFSDKPGYMVLPGIGVTVNPNTVQELACNSISANSQQISLGGSVTFTLNVTRTNTGSVYGVNHCTNSTYQSYSFNCTGTIDRQGQPPSPRTCTYVCENFTQSATIQPSVRQYSGSTPIDAICSALDINVA
ncbi:MAG: hypothetical protein HN878_03615 [Candidatus Diapherotrites archaeon]|nr:hypothetical protein [Candidatus Diapherotrites archaeon]